MTEKIGWFELNVTDKQRECPAFLIFALPDGEPLSYRTGGDCYWPDITLALDEVDGEPYISELRIGNPNLTEHIDIIEKLLAMLQSEDFTSAVQVGTVLSEFLHDGMPANIKR